MTEAYRPDLPSPTSVNIEHAQNFTRQIFVPSSIDVMQNSLGFTAIFTLVVSSAVLVDDVSARTGDASTGSPSFPLAEFCCCRSQNRGTVRLRQRSTNLEPMRKEVISLKHLKLRVDT